MMFATRRSLSEASTKITKELENVYASILATKRHLSSRIDQVESNLDECAELTAATREEVSELRGDMKVVGGDVRSVRHAVQSLETKLNRIEGKQAAPSSSSMPALELPQMTTLSKLKRHMQSALSASGLKELHGISDVEESLRSPEDSNRVHVTENTNHIDSSSNLFGRRLPGFSTAFISRTYSAMRSFK